MNVGKYQFLLFLMFYRNFFHFVWSYYLNKKSSKPTNDIYLCNNINHINIPLGGIHKLRHTLRGAEGVDEVWHCVTREGRDPKFCDITFQKQY